MWLVALLVNSNTLEEMGTIWRNICIVLLSPSQNDQFKLSLSTLSKMADDMNKDPDKTNFILQHVSVSAKGQCSSSLVAEVRSKTVSLNQDALEWNEYHSAKHEHFNRWCRLACIDSKGKRERNSVSVLLALQQLSEHMLLLWCPNERKWWANDQSCMRTLIGGR